VSARLPALAASGVVALVAALGGCSSAGLDVQYPGVGASAVPLAALPRRHVDIGPVTDHRANTARIGVDPKTGHAVVTSRPVTDIVREALVAEVGRTGPASASEGRDLVLSAAIEDFRLDEISGYGSVLYVGRVVIVLRAIDGKTSQTLLTRRYIGIKRWLVDKPADSVRRETMNAALARTMHDLAMDITLHRRLERVRAHAGRWGEAHCANATDPERPAQRSSLRSPAGGSGHREPATVADRHLSRRQ
jgi:hypothetical protein